MSTELVTQSERLAALKKRARTPIEIWQPGAGDSLIGEIVGSRKAVGAYGENYQIIVKEESGNLTAAWLTNWLKDNMKAQDAGVGDLIALTFLGKKLSPAGKNYNAYSLEVDKS